MELHRDCLGTISLIWIVTLIAMVVLMLLLHNTLLKVIVCALGLSFMGFSVWFHRLPERECKGSETEITAVADGKVVILEKVYEKEYLKRECIQLSIYMNFFDVHSNFYPMTGQISYYKYHDGKYLLAFHPKASEKNEHSSTAIKNEHGEILFKQIAGTFARRIVCYSEPGKEVKSGEDCGIIKFGSRIDYFLPLDADIKVKIGDLTRACETVVAELK